MKLEKLRLDYYFLNYVPNTLISILIDFLESKIFN